MKKVTLLITTIIIVMLPFVFAGSDSCSIQEPCGTGYNATYTTSIENVQANYLEEPICVVYFYGKECSKCVITTPFVESLEQKYGNKIAVTKYEIYHNIKNYQLYNSFCGVKNILLEERGVPLAAIDNEYFVGVGQIKERLEPKIQEMLETGERACPLEGYMECYVEKDYKKEDINPFIQNLKTGITTPLIIGAGLIDGINPCAFAVLIFLLAFLMDVSLNKRRMIKAGTAYITAVYITYFLAGLGLLSAIQISGASSIIVKVAAAIAIITGLVNIKDYFWYGRGFTLKIPDSKKGTIEGLVKKANIPAALILGFLVSMFELPCTGGVYLVILAMLSSTVAKAKAIYYLLIYNAMFVLPLIIVMIVMLKGMKAEHIENWRKSKRNIMKLVMGLLLLGLGVAMVVGWV